jgi:L-ascorbate metabolism protein UlaG (beta-lactamase superfamily)
MIRDSVLLLAFLSVLACNRSPPSSAATTASPAPSATAAPTSRENDVVKTSSGDVTITPLHHGTVLLDVAGKAVYFDPTKDSNYDGLPKAAAIFVTDIHGDHMDPPAIEKLSDAETVVIAPAAVAEKLPKSIANVRVMHNGEATTTKAPLVPPIPSLGVEAVPMYNKVRGPAPGRLFHDKGRGNGYVISFGGKRFYVSGDTECIDEMKALKDIDVAFVCMNLPYTMPPSEAAECVAAFGPKIVYPYHYRGSDPHELEKALSGRPIEVRLRSWY